MHSRSLLVPALLLLAPIARAQRGEATLTLQKASACIDYGIPRYGNHSLDALPVGQTWRLGANQASTLDTRLPLIAGRHVVAPGAYRIRLSRKSDDQFEIEVEGAGFRMHPGTTAVPFPCLHAEVKKGTDRLEITWDKERGGTAEVQPSEIVVNFGPHQLRSSVTAVALENQKLKGWSLQSFRLPSKLVEERNQARWLTPFAVLERKGKAERDAPERFLLFVNETTAEVSPESVAPTDSFGFGELIPPAPEWTFAGRVQWQDTSAEADHLEIDESEITKEGEIRVVGLIGQRSFEVVLPQPLKAQDNGKD